MTFLKHYKRSSVWSRDQLVYLLLHLYFKFYLLRAEKRALARKREWEFAEKSIFFPRRVYRKS